MQITLYVYPCCEASKIVTAVVLSETIVAPEYKGVALTMFVVQNGAAVYATANVIVASHGVVADGVCCEVSM
jgi:hypothetical protein